VGSEGRPGGDGRGLTEGRRLRQALGSLIRGKGCATGAALFFSREAGAGAIVSWLPLFPSILEDP